MKLIQILTREHQLILSVLTLLHLSREKLETNPFVPGAFFRSAMIFCSEFAEKRASCTQCQFYKLVRAEEGSLNIRTKFLRFVRPGSTKNWKKSTATERCRANDR